MKLIILKTRTPFSSLGVLCVFAPLREVFFPNPLLRASAKFSQSFEVPLHKAAAEVAHSA